MMMIGDAEYLARADESRKRIEFLESLPHWEFIVVMGEGFFSEECAGTTYKDEYYDEKEIYFAYLNRYPDAQPLC